MSSNFRPLARGLASTHRTRAGRLHTVGSALLSLLALGCSSAPKTAAAPGTTAAKTQHTESLAKALDAQPGDVSCDGTKTNY
jgi:hypothetical protein